MTQALNQAAFTPIHTGFHVLADCDTRTHLVAFYDGNQWWVPGNDRPFLETDVATLDGNHSDGRFHYDSAVQMPAHAYGTWQITNGRI